VSGSSSEIIECASSLRAARLQGLLTGLALLFAGPGALAQTIPDIDISDSIPTDELAPALRMIGMLTTHRPYMGASSLLGDGAGGMGLDLGLEATLMGIPSDVLLPGSSEPLEIPSIPVAKLHLAKALGPSIDLALSGLLYKGTYIIGGSAKLLLYRPLEGFEWALRGGVNFTSLDISEITGTTIPLEDGGFELGTLAPVFRTQTWTLHLVTSKVMAFSEPYISFGLNYTQAQLATILTLNAIEESQVINAAAVSQVAADATLGVRFRMPAVGLRLGFEGSFNSASMHTLGIKIGVAL